MNRIHFPALSSPDLFFIRAPGAGLGNLLFPICRAYVSSCLDGGSYVPPTLRQVKLGTYVRRESDRRTYGDVFKNRSVAESIEWSRVAALRIAGGLGFHSRRLVVHSGNGRQFHDLFDQKELVKNFLKDASKKSVDFDRYDIAIHVRRGDFAKPSHTAVKQNTQIPLDWYKTAYNKAKEIVGVKEPKTVVFGDQNPVDIVSYLGISNCSVEPSGNALQLLFAMSSADILVGSRSTFSLWGQFLGDSYAVWPVGFDLQKYKPIELSKDWFV